jgi:hypothetical protein
MHMFDPADTCGVTWVPASQGLLPRPPAVEPLQEPGCYAYAGERAPLTTARPRAVPPCVLAAGLHARPRERGARAQTVPPLEEALHTAAPAGRLSGVSGNGVSAL